MIPTTNFRYHPAAHRRFREYTTCGYAVENRYDRKVLRKTYRVLRHAGVLPIIARMRVLELLEAGQRSTYVIGDMVGRTELRVVV